MRGVEQALQNIYLKATYMSTTQSVESRREQFLEKFYEVTTYKPGSPAGIALGELFDSFIDQVTAEAREEEFIKGFMAGFYESGEGHNGEYTYPELRGTVLEQHLLKEAKDAYLTIAPEENQSHE